MIAPFWTDNDIGKSGDVFYRGVTRDGSTDEELFERADDLICQSGTIDSPSSTEWMFIVTWDHVGYYGSDQPGCIVS